MPAPELLPEVRNAYAENLADPSVASLEEIEHDLAIQAPRRREEKCLITDVIAELEDWVCFHPEEDSPDELTDPLTAGLPAPPPPPPHPAAPTEPYLPPKPIVRPPKIGRNAPCPCGSGKKYKKCCGKD